jgi:hypothetical protein
VEATYLLLVTPGIILIIIVSHVLLIEKSPTNLLLPAERLRLDGAGSVSDFDVLVWDAIYFISCALCVLCVLYLFVV